MLLMAIVVAADEVEQIAVSNDATKRVDGPRGRFGRFGGKAGPMPGKRETNNVDGSFEVSVARAILNELGNRIDDETSIDNNIERPRGRFRLAGKRSAVENERPRGRFRMSGKREMTASELLNSILFGEGRPRGRFGKREDRMANSVEGVERPRGRFGKREALVDFEEEDNGVERPRGRFGKREAEDDTIRPRGRFGRQT